MRTAVWAIYLGTGMIFYLGLLVARVTGEDLMGRERTRNFFDRIFLPRLTLRAPFVHSDPSTPAGATAARRGAARPDG